MAEDLDLDSILDDDEFMNSLMNSEEELIEDEDDIDDNKNTPKADDDSEDKSEEGNNKKPEVTPSKKLDDESSEKLSLFASALAEEGVISTKEEDLKNIKSFEDLKEAIYNEIKQNEFSSLTDSQKEYLKAIENGFSHEEFLKQKEKELSVESLDVDKVSENEDLQKQLIIDDFVSKGYSKEKAEKLADRSFDLGTNKEDALEALEAKKEEIKKEKELAEENKKAQIENSQKQLEKIKEDIKKVVYDEKKEVLPGRGFSKQLADEVYEALTKPAAYTEDGQPLTRAQKVRSEDPIDFEYKLNYLLALTKNFTDFSSLETTQNTRKAKEFVDRVTNSSSSNTNAFLNLDDDTDLDWIEKNLIN